MISPRWYQQDLIDKTRAAWAGGARDVVIVSPPRSGKTKMAVWLSEPFLAQGVPVFMQAHRAELVKQIAGEYAEHGHMVDVLAPSDVVAQIIHEQTKTLGRSFVRRGAPMVIGSVQTVLSRAESLPNWANRVGLWITDECFPAGTMIDGRPIEDIRVGDEVLSYDTEAERFCRRRVTRVFENSAPDLMLNICAGGDRTITCTLAHPFLTTRGWVEAMYLRPGIDALIFHPNGGPNTRGGVRFGTVNSVEVADTPSRVASVHNLEVEGTHTYVANGIVVHNCHHCLSDNQWGKVIQLFPNALGLGFSATPARTDCKSLARSQGGVFDAMVKGVTARQLIREGHICEYRIIAPPASIDRTSIRVGSTGDFTQAGLTDARKHSTITGDAVASYLRFTPGENAIVFAVDIEHAMELCAAYRSAGVTAEAVSSKTPSSIRSALMSKFERGVFNVLVNVDLFGEGLNVKGITTVIMCRPTQSFVLYVQQFFRALTKADGKHRGTIIDHAGNVGYFGKIYGMPDTYNGWTLEAEERGSRRGVRDPEIMPVTTCVACFTTYESTLTECPHCGHKPEPVGRSKPEQVDGDVIELSPEVLAELRGEINRIDGEPLVPQHLDAIATRAAVRRWNERRDGQAQLRETMALWCGVRHVAGDTDRQMQKRFFFRFGVDILTAQTLNATDAAALNERIAVDMSANRC